MWNEIPDVLDTIFGNIDTDLNAFQMAMRAFATFIVAVVVIRIGNKRLFAQGTAFDIVVAIMFGSVMSRVITGSGTGTMLATWAGGLTLILMHRLLATLTHHLSWFGPLVKGHAHLLIKDGEVREEGLRITGTTEQDLDQAMRSSGNAPDVSKVQLAYQERDGSISVVPKSSEPKILEVTVQDGVQTLRIMLD